jgi:hypothetical protein
MQPSLLVPKGFGTNARIELLHTLEVQQLEDYSCCVGWVYDSRQLLMFLPASSRVRGILQELFISKAAQTFC